MPPVRITCDNGSSFVMKPALAAAESFVEVRGNEEFVHKASEYLGDVNG